MKRLLQVGWYSCSPAWGGFLFKCGGCQISWIAPPCLDLWDRTERIEAARQAARKYEGLP
jgi:hypothetical protein